MIFVSGDMRPLLCVRVRLPDWNRSTRTESTATVACPGCGQHYRVVRFWKLYKAMISIDDVMKIEYRCHEHGVIEQGETSDLTAERPENCPAQHVDGSVCGAPLFVALIHT